MHYGYNTNQMMVKAYDIKHKLIVELVLLKIA